jgi:hypothetical protein
MKTSSSEFCGGRGADAGQSAKRRFGFYLGVQLPRTLP